MSRVFGISVRPEMFYLLHRSLGGIPSRRNCRYRIAEERHEVIWAMRRLVACTTLRHSLDRRRYATREQKRIIGMHGMIETTNVQFEGFRVVE